MTRARQWAAPLLTAVALASIASITIAASIEALRIGPAAAALLYLLPVLWVSAQAGLAAGLTGAVFAAFCYNFFFLEPRYTLRIHGVGDIATFAVLTVVATVTSRLASGLRIREIEARARAEASAVEADFAVLLAKSRHRAELDAAALAFLVAQYGEAQLVLAEDIAAKRTGLAPLEAAAAAWALYNGGPAGQATEVMPAADLHFVPLERGGVDVLALGANGRVPGRDSQLAQALARLWLQARDRLTAETERVAREDAEQREALRQTLVVALGHDFRTPLTVLKSGLGELGGEQAVTLGHEVDRIIRLSEDLIASARLESGQPVRIEPVDLVDALAAALPVACAEGVVVRTDIPADLPLVHADPVLLSHVIGNLLDNAVRHARTTVTVSGACIHDDVRLDIADDGDGIEPAIVATLFDRFVVGSGRQGNSGLGLTIARDLAKAFGASLLAANSPGGGARISLHLRPFPTQLVQP